MASDLQSGWSLPLSSQVGMLGREDHLCCKMQPPDTLTCTHWGKLGPWMSKMARWIKTMMSGCGQYTVWVQQDEDLALVEKPIRDISYSHASGSTLSSTPSLDPDTTVYSEPRPRQYHTCTPWEEGWRPRHSYCRPRQACSFYPDSNLLSTLYGKKPVFFSFAQGRQ